jgi:Anti-sigma factor NepR
LSDDRSERGRHRSTSLPKMPERAVDAVGQRIKASYGRLLQEPVPDRFLELLEELEESTNRSEKSPSASKSSK